MIVKSVNLGIKKTITWKNKEYTTGIFKYAVDQPIFLNTEDVDGDAVIDRRYHGGIEKAVYAYGYNHYEYWQTLFPEIDFKMGMFGENLTLNNLNETDIFQGDQFKLGESIIEVTKPREPCVKLGIRFNNSRIIKEFWNSNKSGVYFKVLQPGKVFVNDELLLIHRNNNNPSIADIYEQKKAKKDI